MRAALILLVACGSNGGSNSSPPPPEVAAKPAAPAVSNAEPPPTGVFAQLHDADGPVAGLDALVVSHRADPSRCGGTTIDVAWVASAAVDPSDAAFVAVFAAAPQTSSFQAEIAALSRRGKEAADHYFDSVATATATGKVIAVARVSQLWRLMASAIARGPIPNGLAASDAGAYCDGLANFAGAMLKRADEMAQRCHDLATSIAPGWWTPVC